MSAMRDMSRAIRHELSEYGPTLQSLPDQELRDLTEIVGAFFYDMVGEQDRRGWGSARPAATVAKEIADLRAALATAVDVAIWMSGSDAFSPEGEAGEAWPAQRERLYEAMKLLPKEEV